VNVDQLIAKLQELRAGGDGDARLAIADQGGRYFGELVDVGSLEVDPEDKTLPLVTSDRLLPRSWVRPPLCFDSVGAGSGARPVILEQALTATEPGDTGQKEMGDEPHGE
jgi:hypothetical protein